MLMDIVSEDAVQSLLMGQSRSSKTQVPHGNDRQH